MYALSRSIVLTILYVGNKPGVSISQISRKIGMNHSHTNKVFKPLVENSIITAERIGRRYYIRLTSKGERMYDNLNNIRKEFDGFVLE